MPTNKLVSVMQCLVRSKHARTTKDGVFIIALIIVVFSVDLSGYLQNLYNTLKITIIHFKVLSPSKPILWSMLYGSNLERKT